MAESESSVAAGGCSSCPSTSEHHNVKSILKHKPEHQDHPEVKWDEMNILETYHPANKDYGHMKINEPPTPYNREGIEDEDEDLDPGHLSAKLYATEPRKDYKSEESDDADDNNLTDEAKAKKKKFRECRKKHYNEFENVKKARELITKELAELEDSEDGTMDVSK